MAVLLNAPCHHYHTYLDMKAVYMYLKLQRNFASTHSSLPTHKQTCSTCIAFSSTLRYCSHTRLFVVHRILIQETGPNFVHLLFTNRLQCVKLMDVVLWFLEAPESPASTILHTPPLLIFPESIIEDMDLELHWFQILNSSCCLDIIILCSFSVYSMKQWWGIRVFKCI